jgi:hypothetical protein
LPSLKNKIHISTEALSKAEIINNDVYVFTVGFTFFETLVFMRSLTVVKSEIMKVVKAV